MKILFFTTIVKLVFPVSILVTTKPPMRMRLYEGVFTKEDKINLFGFNSPPLAAFSANGAAAYQPGSERSADPGTHSQPG